MTIFSCATTRNAKFSEADDLLVTTQYEKALEILADPSTINRLYPPTDQVLKYLDIGMLHFYSGNYEQAQDYLTEAEYLMEELFTKSIVQAVGSLLLNDTVVDYPGESYESLYTNAFKAISFLEEGYFDGAYVEIQRLNDKLNLFEDKHVRLAESYNSSEQNKLNIAAGKTEFYNSALARFLSLLIYRSDGDIDGARIDSEQFAMAFANQPQIYDFPQPDISHMLQITDQARLNVLAFTGRIPRKRAAVFFIRSFEDQIVVFFQYENERGELIDEELDIFIWPEMVEGYQFKFEVPFLEDRKSDVVKIRVLINNNLLGHLDLIEDMGQIAHEVYKLKEPIIFLKTVVRTVVKGLLGKSLKDSLEDADLKNIFGIIIDAATYASEVADLRTARYYPSLAYAGEFHIPPGVHELSLEYYDINDNLIIREEIDEQDYRLGKLNLLHTYLPQ